MFGSFCKYPQEIVLRLEFPAKIQQMQVLSHEYKVSSTTTHKLVLYGTLVMEVDKNDEAMFQSSYSVKHCYGVEWPPTGPDAMKSIELISVFSLRTMVSISLTSYSDPYMIDEDCHTHGHSSGNTCHR